jgi:transposase
MCDALSRNLPKLPIILGYCNAHARGRFVQVAPNFPQECRFVLESFGEVYGYDAAAEERGLTPEERLRFHQEHGGPVMDNLHAWLVALFEEKRVEPNSGLGTAVSYDEPTFRMGYGRVETAIQVAPRPRKGMIPPE